MVVERGAPLPRDGERRWFKVYSVPTVGALHLICLSPIWDGHWSHWDGTRSYRCTETPGCEGCHIGHAHRWTGYLAAYEQGQRTGECVAALTPGACLYLERRIILPGLDLRGVEMKLTRRKPKEDGRPAKNAAVSVELLRRHPVEKLKAEFETLPSVLRMWGIHQQHSARIVREQETPDAKRERNAPWQYDEAMRAKLTEGIGRE